MNAPIRLTALAALLLSTLAFAPTLAFAQDDKSAIPGTPNLAVASVKVENGIRVSKVIGAAVYNGNSQQVGTVDDVILDNQQKASLAVISVGGFLGVGGKLVAEPYSALKMGGDGKVILPDGTKEALNQMPSFTYTP
jgi:sporulation protein YlmC with PRC-barrel domain